MLYSVAGSQGLGKSVFIKYLSDRGYHTIERKTSRSVLSDWGVSLSEVNNDRPLTLKFQDEILARKIDDEAAAAASDEAYVTERSFADLFVYAVAAIGKDNECSDWLDAYYNKCLEAQKSYAGVMYLTAEGRIDGIIVADGVRGINQHYGHMIDLTMSSYTKLMCDLQGVPVYMCDESTPEARAAKMSWHLVRPAHNKNPNQPEFYYG